MEKQFTTEEYNIALKNWSMNTASKLKSSIRQHAKNNKSLSRSLNTKTARTDGEIDRISFNFERHGIFFAKGVGRGYKMINGTVVRTATAISFIRRTPQDWFNQVLDTRIPELANTIAEMRADQVINATQMKI